MAKYKHVLVKKIEESRKQEKKQEKLRTETGIRNKDFVLKERTWSSYARDIIGKAGYVIFVILAFIGIMMVLNPGIKEYLTADLPFDLR